MLSEQQQAILRFLYDYNQTNGISPTIREIRIGTDSSSTSVVNYHLKRLINLGYIRHFPGRSRAYTLTKQAHKVLMVSPVNENHFEAEPNSLEYKVQWLQAQNERLKRAYRLESETRHEERAALVDEINKLKMIVASLIEL
jgi:SOS-response transcriptional repressor LexA